MDIKKLREEFSTVHGEATALIEKAAGENRDLTADEQAENEKRFSRLKTIQTTIDEHLKFAGMKLNGDENAPGTVTAPADPSGKKEFEDATQAQKFADIRVETKEQAEYRFAQHKAAVAQYLRTGRAPQQFAAITTGSDSGILLPTMPAAPIFLKRLPNAIRAAILSRGMKPITTDGAENIPLPIFDDTGNVADTNGEDASGDNEKEPTLGGPTLGATLYDSGTAWFANTLLLTTSYDLVGAVQPQLDQRVELKQEAAWMASLKSTATVGVTAADTDTVTFDELVDWQHSIAPENRPFGAFILSDGLLRAIRGIKDNQGRPLYQESLTDDAPNQLLGWPIFISNSLSAPGANVVTGMALATNLCFIRDVNNRRITRYTNQPAYPDKFGVREFANGDFKFHANGARAFKMAAS